MNAKKLLYPLLLATFCLVGCQNENTNLTLGFNSSDDSENITSEGSTSMEIGNDYYDKVNERAQIDNESELNFTQTFENGLDDKLFSALEGAWHTDTQGAEHRGMQHRNLFYTNDGKDSYLAIKARGYYTKEDPEYIGIPEGGCIVSKEHLGPGRYEIEMAAMPREGGVTAMWSYCTTTGNENSSQNEIDIEIGGTTNGTNFQNMWCTSWTKKTVKDTDTVDVTDQLYLNDGKIHKYTYDWYTNYNNEGTRRVDWFIDGVFIKSLEGNVVPEHEMPLWIGVWFPPLWAGSSSFVEDYMLVKKISYTSFDLGDQYVEDCRTNPGYNKVDPSSLNMKTLDFNLIKNLNKLSNGDMESLDKSSRDQSYYGWNVETASKGSIELTNGNHSEHGFLLKASLDTSEANHGEYVYQSLTNAYENYRYDLSLDAKKIDNDSEGNIEIHFQNLAGKDVSKILIPIDSLEYKTYTKELICPKNTYKITITLTSENGSIAYDNASLIYKA